MSDNAEIIKKKYIKLLFLLAIIVTGIFFRVYNFHDLLRFNADQSRDAGIVRDFLEGQISLPLSGPLAGGTSFALGPIFYYFQIISAKIFGIYPDKMAYPDLFFSILTIPLLYLLFKKYFNESLSIALTGLMSVSMFCVQYSRFAWNPNSAPFFVSLFLYSLLMLSDDGAKKKFIWAALTGTAMGIGMQLHTLLLVAMPLSWLFFLGYVYRVSGRKMAKEFVVIFLFALFLNVPQIFGEIQSGGQNIQAFLEGTAKKTDNEIGIAEKFTENILCQIQGNNYIISTIGPNGDCGIKYVAKNFKKHRPLERQVFVVAETLFGLIFTIGGIILWVKNARRENDDKKNKFLMLLGIYFLTVSVFLILLANEISTRFYLVLEFLPFLLLGFWVDEILKWTKDRKTKIVIVILTLFFIALAVVNIYKTCGMFRDFFLHKKIENNESLFITLSETEFIANYIAYHTSDQKAVYLKGKKLYLFKYARSIDYFTKKEGIMIKEYSKKEKLPENATIFFLENAENSGRLDKKTRAKYQANDPQIFGRLSIAKLHEK
ncbi:MAG TPA: glycosyltransferase family 39 protein [Candidatus Moranbacteria bacterium]|nr:glycosyltransferase family 39 protein [Candidatus Moranbacteria bacterium]HRZ33891.1 glycosyltransferase family 39 protein [Candidatus Moranbacteria bacterium]